METTRQAKISRLLQKELSEIFRQQTAKLRGVLVSVSAVRVSPDLSVAKAYLSVFPSDKAEEMLDSIDNLLTRDKEAHPGRLDDAVAEGNHDA